MANFIFNWAGAALTAAILDLSTGNYYAHLVTTVPTLGHSTVADLVLPTTSGYTSTALTGLSYNSTRWTFDSFSFPKYNFISAPTGVVICRRSGATSATSDGIICYSDFNNSIGQTINVQVGTYVVNLRFGSQGAINFSYRYQYSSGSYANTEQFPKGLIFLIGSSNNTITFQNPQPTKIVQSGYSPILTDRSIASIGSSAAIAVTFDFINSQVRIGQLALLNGVGINSTSNATVEVSNDGLTWQSILQQNNVTFPSLSWLFLDCNATIFYRYFRVTLSTGSASRGIAEIELYNSSILSSTLNIA